MIAKGNPHNNGPRLARYLTADSRGNERVEIRELRGFASDNILEAFALGQILAEGTRAENPFFHVQVRLPKNETLDREEWQAVADRIEGQLGFDGQARAIVFHQKDGQEHMHLAWSRIDVETMRAIDPGLYKRKLKEVCRKLEKEMGLQQVRNKRKSDEKTKPAARPEYEQSRRLKTDLKVIRENIRDCWDKSDNGRHFMEALEEKDLMLAQGDRRAFVVVDLQGGYHALSKRITGATAKDTAHRLADLGKNSLPKIEEAKAVQLEKYKKKELMAMPDQRAVEEEEQRKEAVRIEEEKRQDAVRQEEENREKAVLEEEERRREITKEAAQKEEERARELFKEQAERQVAQAQEMKRREKQLEAFRADLSRAAEDARREEARRLRTAQPKEAAIRSAQSRYGQALAQNYDVLDPYRSLARSAMAEHGAFLRDRENLELRIAKAKDPHERQVLELQKRIEGAEYMAITSRRIANQSAVVHGKLNPETLKLESAESIKENARAASFKKEAEKLRQEYRELQVGRAPSRQNPPSPGKEPSDKEKDHRKPTEEEKTIPFMVQERPVGKPKGEVQELSAFVKNVTGTPPARTITPDQIRRDPAARRDYYQQLTIDRQRDAALRHLGRDMKAGRPLSAEDVRHLSRDEIEGIKKNGDNHLKQITAAHQRQRDRERER